MPIMSSKHQLTKLENFSCVAEWIERLSKLNDSDHYRLAGPLAARVLGVAVLPLAGFADTVIHAQLAVGKTFTGIFISPYNSLAAGFFPSKMAPHDFELSSAAVHFYRVFESLFAAAILPFICLLNPTSGYQLMRNRSNKGDNQHQEQIDHLKHEVKDLQKKLSASHNPVSSNEGSNQQALTLQIANLQNTIRLLEQDKVTLQQDINQRMTASTTQQQASAQQMTDLQNKIQLLEQEKANLQQDINNKMAASTTQQQASAQQVTDLQNKIQLLEQEKTHLQTLINQGSTASSTPTPAPSSPSSTTTIPTPQSLVPPPPPPPPPPSHVPQERRRRVSTHSQPQPSNNQPDGTGVIGGYPSLEQVLLAGMQRLRPGIVGSDEEENQDQDGW